jgi:hypothetical protein
LTVRAEAAAVRVREVEVEEAAAPPPAAASGYAHGAWESVVAKSYLLLEGSGARRK